MTNTLLLLALSGLPVLSSGAVQTDPLPEASARRNGEAEPAEKAPSDQPLAAWRVELLDLAFRAASSLPLNPHVKDVARMQAEVVEAALELDQPRKALAFAREIPDWRLGFAHARYASWCVRHGAAGEARRALDVAREIAQRDEDYFGQSWRRDRVRAGIAEALYLLGDEAEAARFAEGLEESQAEPVRTLRAREVGAKAFETEIKALEDATDSGDFDTVKNALSVCAELYDAFYADAERRQLAAATIQGGWQKLPGQIRVELACRMADAALTHGDAENALALVDEASKMIATAGWTLEYRVPLIAELVRRRHAAGDQESAEKEADAALASFVEDRLTVVDMFRAEALVPLAEAYRAMDAESEALSVYEMAVAEALENPASRPRAADLARICASMAVHGVKPDENLVALLQHVCDTLGHEYGR